MTQTEQRPIGALRVHPRNAAIYGDAADADLIESVRLKGVLEPLLITDDGRIVGGHRRWQAAQQAGLADVPVVIFGSDDEFDILEAVIETNRQRIKTREQEIREFKVLKEIESERARQRMGGPENFPDHSDARDAAAKKFHRSGKTMEKGASIVDAIDELEEQGESAAADELRDVLNGQSVDRAYRQASANGLFTRDDETAAPTPESPLLLTLSTWRSLSAAERRTELARPPSTPIRLNEQSTTKIQWAQWSWNPVTGCKHDCSYCYARDIAQGRTRIAAYPQLFEPTFLPERMGAPAHTSVPAESASDIGYKNVFTCSMADLFGKWVPQEWIDAVLNVVRENPQWNFLFLTKFPQRLAELEFPANAWVGTTIDAQARVRNAEEAFGRIKATVKWLSIEPLLEPIHFEHPEYFDWFAIGGASASTETPEWHPPLAWVADLEHQARSAGVRVYHKANLYAPRREYPGGQTQEPLNVAEAFHMRYLQRDVLEPRNYAREMKQ